ncbi:MAG: sulfite exporter TauE/SafE family protein [Spirochaetales bacterium]|nr:sulfite exporter TauE/SafE family protein [Spirochaetales bacterium]
MFIIVAFTVLIATTVGSISGIGGGVLIKPIMDALCDMSTSQISFMSGLTVLTMTIVSLGRSIGGPIRLDRRGFFLAIGSAIGGVAGKALFDMVKSAAGNDAAVGLCQNIIMVILTGLVFVYTLKKQSISTKNFRSNAISLSMGIVLGIFSSFLGIGGGPINLMILSYFFSMDTKTAAFNSLFCIFFSQVLSLISTMLTGRVPSIDWRLMVTMMVLAVVGATFGRSCSKKMDNRAVDRLFMALMVVIILLSIYNCIRFGMAL